MKFHLFTFIYRHRLYYKVLPIFYCFDDCGGRTLSTMWVLVIRNTIACDTYHFHSLQTIQWPFLSYRWEHCRPGHFCIEMLHCRLKMIARNICVLICNNLFLLADTWTQTVLWKLSHWIYLLLRGSGFPLFCCPSVCSFIHSCSLKNLSYGRVQGGKDLIR